MIEYMEVPWEIEDTVENLKKVKEILQKKFIRENFDEKGKQDSEAVGFDFDRAISACEKQIPKKPETKMLGTDIEWKCPACGESHILMDSRKGFKYCHHCGQKLDWSEVQES